MEMPVTYKQVRRRMSNIDNFLMKLDAGEVDLGRTCDRLRVEVRLTIPPGSTQADTVKSATEFTSWLLDHVQPVAVPVQIYR